MILGYMPMPDDFRYREVAIRGKPNHQEGDDFLRRHPRMMSAKRAKIFSPFDALKGFQEALEKEERRTEGNRRP